MRARDSAQHEQNTLNEKKCVAVGHMSLVGADDRKMESAVTAATATVAAATQRDSCNCGCGDGCEDGDDPLWTHEAHRGQYS